MHFDRALYLLNTKSRERNMMYNIVSFATTGQRLFELTVSTTERVK